MKDKLKQLGFTLPEASTPGGSYSSVNIRGNIAYVAIQFPIENNTFYYQGKLGEAMSTKEGVLAMQMTALNVLSQVYHKVGEENIIGLNHIEGYYKSTETWDDGPIVVDGASDLFVNVLGEKGQHSRAIFGVAHLPRNFCVGLTATFTIKPKK